MARPEMTKDLAVFDEELSQLHMRGQWLYDALLVKAIGGPQPKGKPHIWKWDAVYPKLVEACEAMPETFTARRSLGLLNPGFERWGTTHTISASIQMIRPGELAWAHRHTIAALRFVIKGNKNVFTVVDGEICPMEDYDLILTPRWSWHDHHNETDEPAIWLDVLDLPFVMGLNATFYETYPRDRQQIRRESKAEYLQARAKPLRPTWEKPKREHLPLRYRWADTESHLKRMAGLRGSLYDGLTLEYVNPMTGGPTLPTLSCWMHMLRPGEQTKPHRHTSSAIYLVIRGEGKTIVGEKELPWAKHDAFCIPNWAWHQHINGSKSEEAVLFSVNDIPVLTAFGLYREEPEDSLYSEEPPPIPKRKPSVSVL